MLGITLLPEYIQSEGIERLLDNLLKRAPVTAISTSPYVMSELSAEEGGAQPRLHERGGLVVVHGAGLATVEGCDDGAADEDALVDADLAKESARLQALQVQQQLGAQALSIANQAPQVILSLFRS